MSAGAQMYYRIPSGSKLRNPSWRLHKIAVRVDGSVWIVAHAGVGEAAAIVEELRARGADSGLLYYREDQVDAVHALALEGLRAEVENISAETEKRVARAKSAIADADRLADAGLLAKAQAKTRGKFRAALKRVQAAEQAAVLFGLTAECADLLAALAGAIAAEQETVLGECEAAAATPTEPAAPVIGGCPGCEAQADAGSEPEPAMAASGLAADPFDF